MSRHVTVTSTGDIHCQLSNYFVLGIGVEAAQAKGLLAGNWQQVVGS